MRQFVVPLLAFALAAACSRGTVGDDEDDAGADGGDDAGETDSGDQPDPHQLDGSAYQLDLVDAKWNHPEGLGDVLSGQLTQELVVSVVSIVDASVESRAGFFEGGEQDFCTPTVDFPAGSWDEARREFEIGPADTMLSIAGYTVPVSHMEISGEISEDGTELIKGRMQGELDARELGDVIGELAGTENPAQICELVTSFGVECVDCTSDGRTYCIEVDVSDMLGELLDTGMACVAEADCHDSCSSSTCDDTSAGECE